MTLFADIEVGGETLRARLPESTREVLEYRSFVGIHLERAFTQGGPGLTRAVQWMIDWMADRVDRDADWIDENLGTQETHIACLQIIAIAGLPVDVAQEIEKWAQVMGSGGCQCAICQTPEKAEKWDQKTRAMQKEKCRTASISHPAQELIGCVHSLDGSDMLNAPWYLYQARERYEVGLAFGRREIQREREKRDKFLQALEEAGVRRPRRR